MTRSLVRGSGALVFGVLLFLEGCGADDASSTPPDLQVVGGWVRAMTAIQPPGPSGGSNSAAYFTVRNGGGMPDRLLGGETTVASALEIHESREEDGVMRMRPVEGIDLPPGGEAELRPGGLHVMLLGLTRSLMPGDTITLTLRFQRSGEVVVRVPVRLAGPSQG